MDKIIIFLNRTINELILEAHPGIEPSYKDLQLRATPIYSLIIKLIYKVQGLRSTSSQPRRKVEFLCIFENAPVANTNVLFI